MNNNVILVLSTFLLLTGCQDNTIQISGKLNKAVKGEYIFLDELKANTIQTIDSVKVQNNGKFTFREEIEFPTFYLLKTNDNNFFTLLLEPGERFRITADFDSLNDPASISGSKGTELMVEYNKALKNTISKLQGLTEIYNQNIDNPGLDKVIQSLDSMGLEYMNEINTYTKKYIDENITSLVSLVALYEQVAPRVNVLNPVVDLNYFIKVDSSLFGLYPESDLVKSLHEMVQTLVASINGKNGQNMILQPGDEAPEIELPSAKGDIIKLSSTRGQIVLLDFWASWCSPCRLENPNLVKAYNKYHNKGFEIYQVSLDKTKDDWLTGIENDKLGEWIHVSDVKYWNSVVVPLYNIKEIPFNLLLDKEGKIIAKNLRGDELQTKLEDLFK